jgi:hypothetical protein
MSVTTPNGTNANEAKTLFTQIKDVTKMLKGQEWGIIIKQRRY